MPTTYEKSLPNIALWVNEYEGFIEIGYDYNTESFVRAIDEGGMVWSGKQSYETLDEALEDLEKGIAKVIKEIYE